MNKLELEKRIRKDLNLPFFKAQIENRYFTEEDYQEFKSSLENYYKDYVQGVDTDFQGGLKDK